MPVCKNCENDKSVDEISKTKPEFCLLCLKRIAQKKYSQSHKSKEKYLRLSKTEKTRLKIKRANKKKTESGYKKRWRDSEEQRAKTLAYNSEYSKKNRERKNAHAKTQRERYPEKEKARAKLKREVRLGNVVKPKNCSSCGIEPRVIEGHHEDYSFPLVVIWLCSKCHRQLHVKKSKLSGV